MPQSWALIPIVWDMGQWKYFIVEKKKKYPNSNTLANFKFDFLQVLKIWAEEVNRSPAEIKPASQSGSVAVWWFAVYQQASPCQTFYTFRLAILRRDTTQSQWRNLEDEKRSGQISPVSTQQAWHNSSVSRQPATSAVTITHTHHLKIAVTSLEMRGRSGSFPYHCFGASRQATCVGCLPFTALVSS